MISKSQSYELKMNIHSRSNSFEFNSLEILNYIKSIINLCNKKLISMTNYVCIDLNQKLLNQNGLYLNHKNTASKSIESCQ